MESTSKYIQLSAGFSILLMTMFAGVAYGYVPGTLYVLGDPSATYRHLVASQSLFRVGVYCWVLIVILDMYLAWALFQIFKFKQAPLATLMGWARLVYAAMLGAALGQHLDIIYLLNQGDANAATEVMQHITTFNARFSLALIVFGVHLVLLGIVALKSDFIPKILAYIILLAAVGYLLNNSLAILLVDYAKYRESVELTFIAPQIIGELGLGILLIVKALWIIKQVR